jgi:ribosomal protein S25
MTDPIFTVPVKMKTIGSQRRYDGLLAALKVEPATRQELQDKIFASKTGTIELLRRLMNGVHEPRKVFIVRWVRDRGGFTAMYALGDKPDAPLPKRRTASQRHAQIKANPATNKERNRKIVLAKRRRRNAEHPGLYEAVVEAVTRFRTGTTPQIAKELGVAYTTAYSFLRELEDDCKIMRTSPKRVNPICWGVYVAQADPEFMPVQKINAEWVAPKVKQQNIFSSLFEL